MPKVREGKTEEERQLLLQQRAQAEEEMKKKKEEIFTLFLQDKLRKEERNSSVNQLKLNDGWRALRRLTRAGELRGGVTELSQTFERQRDGRDSVVTTLVRDLKEAELQWAQGRRVHLQQAELLLKLQRERVTLLQELWERELQQLGRRCSQERKQQSRQVVQRRSDLEDSMLTVAQQHRAAMNEVHRLYSECITAFQTSHDGRREALTHQDQDRLWKETLNNREAAQVCGAEAQKLTDLLMETQQLIEETGRDAQAAKKLQRKVLLQRAALSATEAQNQLAELELAEARRRVSARTLALRDQLIQDRAAARRRLTELTVQSDRAARKLKAIVAKGLKVLRVADLCCKLEREKDVNVVFTPEGRSQKTAGPEKEGPDKDSSPLQQVRMRMNASVLRREALRKRREELREDNRRLQLLLRRQLDAMTVSERVLGARGALLSVGGAPSTSAPPTAALRRHNVIEAAHAVKHSL